MRDILAAIAIFVNGAKGISALQLSRDLDVQYKTAFVMAHKLREAMGAKVQAEEISGHVEIDGAYFGGYAKPANRKEDRRDRRLLENRTGKRRVVIGDAGNLLRQRLHHEVEGLLRALLRVRECRGVRALPANTAKPWSGGGDKTVVMGVIFRGRRRPLRLLASSRAGRR